MDKKESKIQSFFNRLHAAWYLTRQIISGRKYYLMVFEHKDTPDDHVYCASAMDAAWEYLSMMTDNYESFYARLDIIKRALDVDNSILAQYKKGDNCYVSYDCNSEEELQEFLNQDIQ